MMRVRNKKADVLTFLSAIGIVLVLSMSYFVSIYLFHLSYLFLFVFSIIQIPFMKYVFNK